MASAVRISHARALIDMRQRTVSKLIELEKLMPGLLQRKVVSKKIGRRLVKYNDIATLLGILRVKPVEVFVEFLRALADTFSECETHRELVLSMRDSLECIDVPPDSDACRAIQEVIAKALEDPHSTPTPFQKLEEQSSVEEQLSTVSDAGPSSSELTLLKGRGTIPSEESAELQVLPLSILQSTTYPDIDYAATFELQAAEHMELVSGTFTELSKVAIQTEVFAKAAEKQVETALPDPQQMQPEKDNLPIVADEPVAATLASVVSDVSSTESEVVKPKATSTIEAGMTQELQGDVTSGYTYVKPCRSWKFTKEGGLIHCPAHGIIGHIPATAVPPEIDNFEICIKVFIQGDFRFPADVEPCTAIVEFTLHPYFVFAEDITIKLPHCVVVDGDGEIDPEAFCLLTASDEYAPMFKFTEVEGAAVDSNGYHVIAKLRHFSRTAGAHKRRRRSRTRSISKNSPKTTPDAIRQRKHNQMLPDLKRQSSSTSHCSPVSSTGNGGIPLLGHVPAGTDSLTSSLSSKQEVFDTTSVLMSQQSSSKDSMCIVQCMPHEYPGGWETNFLLSCALPTCAEVLMQAVQKVCTGSRANATAFCRPVDSHLRFTAKQITEGWTVDVTTGTPTIAVEQVTRFHHSYPKEQAECLGMYPHRISYLASQTDVSRSTPLRCTIDVKGAEVNGEPLFFMLTSPQMPSTAIQAGARVLDTCQDLYQPESTICSALCASATGSDCDLPLHPRSEDHCCFIADISFQLTKTDFQQLTRILEIKQPQLDSIGVKCGPDLPEQIYQVLLSWMSKNYPNSTMKILQSKLQMLGISGIELSSWRAESVCGMINSQFSKSSIQWDEKLMQAFALEVSQRCKFIGRYIGVLEADIDAIHDTIRNNTETQSELSYQILRKWQQQKGKEATYGVLLKAIYRVFEHDSRSVCSAWWLATKHYQYALVKS